MLEPTTSGDPILLIALLIGVNLGPLITPWASLATLLWHDRMVSLGVQVRWGPFIAWGLAAAVPTVVGAAVLLFLATR